MEWLIQAGAVVLALSLAAVKSLRYAPSETSDDEIARQAEGGSDVAMAEAQWRTLLPTLATLQNIKEIILVVGLALLLFATHKPAVGFALTAVYLLVAYIVVARGWLQKFFSNVQLKVEPGLVAVAKRARPFVTFMAPSRVARGSPRLASRGELQALITADQQVLTESDKTRLLAALEYDTHTIADVMIPAASIATVDISETVGPVLLDRLHKANHNIFVVIKKDLNQIRGLLYMHDLVPLDPDLKTIKDAVRPMVYYIGANQPLMAVLAASLQSGRQLFITVDQNGNTAGLITLRDAIITLFGTAPPEHNLFATDPQKVAANTPA